MPTQSMDDVASIVKTRKAFLFLFFKCTFTNFGGYMFSCFPRGIYRLIPLEMYPYHLKMQNVTNKFASEHTVRPMCISSELPWLCRLLNCCSYPVIVTMHSSLEEKRDSFWRNMQTGPCLLNHVSSPYKLVNLCAALAHTVARLGRVHKINMHFTVSRHILKSFILLEAISELTFMPDAYTLCVGT